MDENLFRLANEKVVKALCRKDHAIWIPNKSQLASNHLGLFSLIERESSAFKLSKNKYFPSEMVLQDVLKDKCVEKVRLTDEVDAGTHNKSSSFSMRGSLSAQFADVFDMKFSNVTAVTLNASMGKLYKKEVPRQSLIKLLQNRKIDMEHDLMSQMQGKSRVALCVVTGILCSKSQPKPVLTANVGFKTGVDVKAQIMEQGLGLEGGVEYYTSKSYEVPEGSILAYKVLELKIDVNTGTARVMVCKGGKGGFRISDCFGGRSAVQAVMREMIHSKGGFMGGLSNATMAADDLQGDDLDTQCSLVVEREPEDMKNSLLEAFVDVSHDEKERFVDLLLQLCAEPESLVELQDSIVNPAKASRDNENIDGIVRIVKRCKNFKYILMMCDAIVNLDEEAQYGLSSLEISQLPLVEEIVASAFEGHSLPFHDSKVRELLREPQAMDLLLSGLDYKLDGDGLTPPTNYIFLESANIALKILKLILE